MIEAILGTEVHCTGNTSDLLILLELIEYLNNSQEITMIIISV